MKRKRRVNDLTQRDKPLRTFVVVLQVGYRHLDCAELYSNEQEIGNALTASAVPREELFLVSKVWNHHHSPDQVQSACRASIKALQVDYLDCYLIHWPVAWDREDGIMMNPDDTLAIGEASDVSIETTWAAMESLVDAGLVRHIGLSNFSVPLVDRILKVCKIKPYCNQVECHPHLQQKTLLDAMREKGVRLVAYHPLGKPSHRKEGEPVAIAEPAIMAMAQRHGKTPAQCVLQWNLQRGVVVIPKSNTPARIKQNYEAADGSFTLTEAEMADMDTLDAGVRFCQPAWMPLPLFLD